MGDDGRSETVIGEAVEHRRNRGAVRGTAAGTADGRGDGEPLWERLKKEKSGRSRFFLSYLIFEKGRNGKEK